MDDRERHEQGMKTRRAVLGDAYVDAAVAKTDDFTREFQDYVVRAAWGDPWQRPGLDLKMRSVIVLSVTMSLGHWDEFRLHLRGAINNGLTKNEIKEILMHCAAYAGIPAANHAFREAQQVFKELGV
jgi:4-carboxymuconolactone decarboxylase